MCDGLQSTVIADNTVEIKYSAKVDRGSTGKETELNKLTPLFGEPDICNVQFNI